MVLFGVDAHATYQAALDVPRLAGEGYSFAIFKATQGLSGYSAPESFDRWVRQARQAGLVPGAYHWLTSGDGARQADRFLARVVAAGGPDGMLLALDVEDTASPPSWETVRAAVARLRARTSGHPVLLYTGRWWWQAGRRWDGASLGAHLWDSRYVSGSGVGSALYGRVPQSWWGDGYGGWPGPTILQFTSRGSAGGISGNIDINAFQGTPALLRALAGTTQEDGVDLKDKVGGTATTDHSGDRSVEELLADLWWAVMAGRTAFGPLWAESPLAHIGAPAPVELSDDQLRQLVDALAARVGVPVQRLLSAAAAAGRALADVDGGGS